LGHSFVLLSAGLYAHDMPKKQCTTTEMLSYKKK